MKTSVAAAALLALSAGAAYAECNPAHTADAGIAKPIILAQAGGGGGAGDDSGSKAGPSGPTASSGRGSMAGSPAAGGPMGGASINTPSVQTPHPAGHSGMTSGATMTTPMRDSSGSMMGGPASANTSGAAATTGMSSQHNLPPSVSGNVPGGTSDTVGGAHGSTKSGVGDVIRDNPQGTATGTGGLQTSGR